MRVKIDKIEAGLAEHRAAISKYEKILSDLNFHIIEGKDVIPPIFLDDQMSKYKETELARLKKEVEETEGRISFVIISSLDRLGKLNPNLQVIEEYKKAKAGAYLGQTRVRQRRHE